MAREAAYPVSFYKHVFDKIQMFNSVDADAQASVNGVDWYNGLAEMLKNFDRADTPGGSQKRDVKKIVSFVSRIKTTMVLDIAGRAGLSAEQQKNLSESIKLPSRSATAQLLQQAAVDDGYLAWAGDFAKAAIKA
jgi:hypothetical protein